MGCEAAYRAFEDILTEEIDEAGRYANILRPGLEKQFGPLPEEFVIETTTGIQEATARVLSLWRDNREAFLEQCRRATPAFEAEGLTRDGAECGAAIAAVSFFLVHNVTPLARTEDRAGELLRGWLVSEMLDATKSRRVEMGDACAKEQGVPPAQMRTIRGKASALARQMRQLFFPGGDPNGL